MSKIYDAIPSFPSLSSLPYLAYLNTSMATSSGRAASTSKLVSTISNSIPEPIRPFVTLSYPIRHASRSPFSSPHHSISSGGTLYGKGPADACFVAFCAVAFTVARELVMRYFWATFARWYLTRASQARRSDQSKKGRAAVSPKRERAEVKKREHVVTRFAEQGWGFLYCTLSTSIGVSLWANYPHTPLPGLTKFYYLAQLGWWFHQIYVINTEKRRHDHYQMFSHHILTISLMVASYAGNFTRVGTVIHVLMDFCDIILPLAKMLRYLSFTTLCDLAFVLFLVSWLFTRQIGLSYVIYTTYVDSPKHIGHFWSTADGHYYTKGIYWSYLAMLTTLLGLATAWFVMALRVAVRVVRGQGAEDSRSDDEDDGEEVDQNGNLYHQKQARNDNGAEEDDEDGGEWEPRTEGKIPSKKEIAKRTEEVKSSVEASPSSTSASSGTGTPRGVQGVQVPGLAGLACKREKEGMEYRKRR